MSQRRARGRVGVGAAVVLALGLRGSVSLRNSTVRVRARVGGMTA